MESTLIALVVGVIGILVQALRWRAGGWKGRVRKDSALHATRNWAESSSCHPVRPYSPVGLIYSGTGRLAHYSTVSGEAQGADESTHR